MSNLLQAAQMTSYRRRKDRTVSVTFTTQEILDIGPIDQMATNESAGILYFRADEAMSINRQEIEELDAVELDLYDEPKPQSKRLRAVLYRVWEQHHQHQVAEFRDYYKAETERIIQHYKDKLE
tara:strand:- start:92 stop:463 length:372 start_codon:yes stop_codon:yes gene_type:complete